MSGELLKRKSKSLWSKAIFNVASSTTQTYAYNLDGKSIHFSSIDYVKHRLQMCKILFQEMLVPCLDCGYLCDLKGVKNFYTIYLINETLEVFFPTNWITRIHRDLSYKKLVLGWTTYQVWCLIVWSQK